MLCQMIRWLLTFFKYFVLAYCDTCSFQTFCWYPWISNEWVFISRTPQIPLVIFIIEGYRYSPQSIMKISVGTKQDSAFHLSSNFWHFIQQDCRYLVVFIFIYYYLFMKYINSITWRIILNQKTISNINSNIFLDEVGSVYIGHTVVILCTLSFMIGKIQRKQPFTNIFCSILGFHHDTSFPK